MFFFDFFLSCTAVTLKIAKRTPGTSWCSPVRSQRQYGPVIDVLRTGNRLNTVKGSHAAGCTEIDGHGPGLLATSAQQPLQSFRFALSRPGVEDRHVVNK